MKKLILFCCVCILTFSVSGQAIHIVNSTNDIDDGVCNGIHCSLREAIRASNTNIGPDSIEFNIPGPGPHVIAVTQVLPGITDSALVIDATTQPGNFPMAGLIVIDGSSLAPGANHGLTVYRSKTEIYGLQIQNFPDDGIQLFSASFLSDIRIGAPRKGNVIIQNGSYGIEGPIDKNVSIQGNYIGTDLQFNVGMGNAWDGLYLNVFSGANVSIGGSRTLNEQNYLCSNLYSGLHVNISDAAQFLPGFAITGNVIGTDFNGTRDLGNLGFTFGGTQLGGGISIIGTGPVVIGGAGGLANIIAFNHAGFYTTVDDRKTIRENFFYCNSYKGISLDGNANAGILPPALLCLQGNTLIGAAPPGIMVDVYLHDDVLCPGSPCQGLSKLGSVTADVTGSWGFDISTWPGAQFTAIAQDAQGNSSEFAACILDPNVIASNSGPYCYGDSIFLFSMLDTAVGNVTFQWFGPAGYTSNVQNPTDAMLPGTYTVVADVMGCGADTAFTDVVVYPVPSDTITDFCLGDSIVINGNVYGPAILYGEEWLAGAAQNGCDSLVVLDLQINNPITARIFSTKPHACFGDTVLYWFSVSIGGVGGGGPLDIVYTTGMGLPDTLHGVYDGYSQKIVVTGDIHFDVLDVSTDLTICPPTYLASDSILVSDLRLSPLISDYSGYGVSCFGENDGLIVLHVTGGVGAIQYDWNLSSLSGDVVTGLSAGNYSVTVSDGAGCSLMFDTLITQPTMFESIVHTEPSTCPGVNDGIIFIDAVLGARGPVEYSLNGSSFLSVGTLPLEIPGLPPGPLNLILMDSIGCVDDLTLFVPLGENPYIDLGSERSILSGDSVLLDFTSSLDPDVITWSPASVVSCSGCPVTYAFPTTSQYVYLTLEDTSGCSVTDSILILVFIPKKVFIPNVFSPNGDQINDVLYVQANDLAVEVEYLIIADRWGDVVFEKHNFPINDPSYGWDGTLGGKTMFPAVFTYLARIRFSDDEIVPYSGTVTLLR